MATPPPPRHAAVAVPTGRGLAVDFDEFIDEAGEDEADEWLADGLVPLHGFTVVGGNPKSGKTLFALDLGYAVASGRSFFGRDTGRAAFLYVTEEGPPFEIRKRAAAAEIRGPA